MTGFKKVNTAKIKEKLEKSGVSRPYYIKAEYPIYKIKEGDNFIRILPPVGDMDDFGLDIFVHSFLGPDRGSYLCVERSVIPGMKRQKCYLCDLYKRMQGKDEELARMLAPRRRVLYWVLDVSEKPQSEEPLVFDAPYKRLGEEILLRCVDRRTGEIIDISDVEEGREVYFKKVGQGRKFPEYVAVELGQVYRISPKLANKIVPLYEVLQIPDEAEVMELVDILYEYSNNGGNEKETKESVFSGKTEKVDVDTAVSKTEDRKKYVVDEREDEEEDDDVENYMAVRRRLLEDDEE